MKAEHIAIFLLWACSLLYASFHVGRYYEAKQAKETFREVFRNGSVCTLDDVDEPFGYCLNEKGYQILSNKADCWTDGCLYGKKGYEPAEL